MPTLKQFVTVAQPMQRRRRYRRTRFFHALVTAMLVCLLVLLPAAAQGRPRDPYHRFADIDTFVEAEMRAARIPGLALGIVKGDQIVHLKGFGLADRSGRPVTPHTLFHVGSVTKPFTALAIMQLVEAGKLDLDAPVQRYLPWFRLADAEASARITVRHLLTHTSGLQDMAAGRPRGERTTEQLVRDLSSAELTQPVGTTYQYCNDCFATLGLIVQTVSGQPYEAYVQQQIFAPLEMRRSSFARATPQPGESTGYQWWFGFPLPVRFVERPDLRGAGGIVSSAEDLSHFLIAQLGGGRYGSAAVVSPAGLAEMHQPTVALPAEQPHSLGWDSGSIDGVRVLSHGGDDPGIAADIVVVPEERWGVVILTNANNVLYGLTAKPRIAAGVTDLLLGRQPPNSGLSFTTLYLVIDIVMTILLALTIKDIVALWRRREQYMQALVDRQQRFRRAVLPIVMDVAGALVLLIGVPQLTSTLMVRPVPLSEMFALLPDLTSVLIVAALLSLARGIVRIALAYSALHRIGASTTVGVPASA